MTKSNSIRYIGAYDKSIDLFEGLYTVPEGITYNSYVILDDKIAVMDSADIRAAEDWLDNLENALGGRKPDYLVISHMEPDHTGSLNDALKRYPDMKIVGNAKTFTMLPRYTECDISERKVVVKEGDTLSLGSHTLTFYMAPMVHWPEVMVSYESSEKILFSADAFGRFGNAEDTGLEAWSDDALRYYVNIVGKYGAQVQALLKKLGGLDIDTICPLHGPVLESDIKAYIGKYNTWSAYKPEEKGVAVCYCSIHGNTKKAALLCADEILKTGTAVKTHDLAREDMSFAVADTFRYDRVVLAAPTYDAALFPPMAEFLSRLKSKNFQSRTVGIIENGSWASMSGKLMREALSGMKNVTVLEPAVTVPSTVKPETAKELSELALEISRV